jgi:hypothetical protein
MADVQRTRAQILTLFADNVTGQISPQDLRDYVVTLMEPEFAYAGDFWKQPGVRETTTDATVRGWKDYSQVMNSACSFTNILKMDSDGGWVRADVADSDLTGIIGLAADSYASDASDAVILRKGMVYNSVWSALFSGFIGRPLYLDSGVPGSISTGITTNSQLIVGWVEASDDAGVAVGKFRFDPEWAIRGT